MKVFHHTEFKVQAYLFVFIPYKKRIGLLFDMYCWVSAYADGEVTTEKAVYYAAVSYCKEKGIRVKFTEDDIKKYLLRITKAEFDNIVKVMQLSSADMSDNVKGQKKK